MVQDDTTLYYSYNADGLRIFKTQQTVTEGTDYKEYDTVRHQYAYVGGLLTAEVITHEITTYDGITPVLPATYSTNDSSVNTLSTQQMLRFTYDASGNPVSVRHTNAAGTTTEYFYVTNLQGDVIALLNSSGATVVTYTYNAWGQVISVGGSLAGSIGQLNPLRYRGYIYDTETNLYYLQSRYYNPEWGRFISADAYVSTGQGLLGNNMFAYCNNNPVRYQDSNGDFPEEDCITESPEELLFPDKEALAASFSLQTFFNNLKNSLESKLSSVQSRGYLLPTEYYQHQKAPQYSTPNSQYNCISFDSYTHSYEVSTAYYDFAGRQVIRIDWTNHGRLNHGIPHIHRRLYSGEYPMGQQQERID